MVLVSVDYFFNVYIRKEGVRRVILGKYRGGDIFIWGDILVFL